MHRSTLLAMKESIRPKALLSWAADHVQVPEEVPYLRKPLRLEKTTKTIYSPTTNPALPCPLSHILQRHGLGSSLPTPLHQICPRIWWPPGFHRTAKKETVDTACTLPTIKSILVQRGDVLSADKGLNQHRQASKRLQEITCPPPHHPTFISTAQKVVNSTTKIHWSNLQANIRSLRSIWITFFFFFSWIFKVSWKPTEQHKLRNEFVCRNTLEDNHVQEVSDIKINFYTVAGKISLRPV